MKNYCIQKLLHRLPTTAAFLCFGAVASTVSAAEPATEARLKALEHELSLLRAELANQHSAPARSGGSDWSSKNPVEAVLPDHDDDIFVQPKQSAVTELKVRGRMHYQFGYSEADGGEDYYTQEFRRMRLGVSGKLLDDWKFELVGDLLPDSGVTALDSAYIRYGGWDGLTLSLEKTRPRFGHELFTSSSEILTVERSNLSNTLDPKKITGASIAGEAGLFNWQVGAYNGELGTNQEENDLHTGMGVPENLLNASIGLDLAEVVGLEKAGLRLDYIHNSDNDTLGGNAYSGVEDAFAASIEVEQGGFGIVAEYMQAELFNGGDFWGFYVMPSLMLSDKLQAVLRYEMMEGDDGATFRHQSRYARNVTGLRGDEYWGLYGGLNYYINKSVKLMLGVEYAELDGTPGGDSNDALTGYSAVRVEF